MPLEEGFGFHRNREVAPISFGGKKLRIDINVLFS